MVDAKKDGSRTTAEALLALHKKPGAEQRRGSTWHNPLLPSEPKPVRDTASIDILVRCPFREPVGITEAFRRYVRALAEATPGKHVARLEPFETYPELGTVTTVAYRASEDEIGKARAWTGTKPGKARARLACFSWHWHDEKGFRDVLARGVLSDDERLRGMADRTALLTMFEMAPPVWPLYATHLLNRCAEVWVPSGACVRALAESEVTRPIVRVPVPWFVDDPCSKLAGREAVEPERSRFYYIGAWPDVRKRPERLLLAFLRGTKPGEAQLTMKSRPHASKAQAAALTEALRDERVCANGWRPSIVREWVTLIADEWDRARVARLHQWGSVYLCASRGEGWNLPAHDAKLSGNRMIYVESGAEVDYAGERDFGISVTGTVEHAPGIRFYDFDEEHVAQAIRLAVDSPLQDHDRDATELERARSDLVGAKMFARLAALGKFS